MSVSIAPSPFTPTGPSAASTPSIWRKLGRIYEPVETYPWMHSHASNPMAEVRGENLVRIYFGTRDAQKRSHVAWLDLELRPRPRVVRVGAEPLVAPGPLGGFDDSGTSMGCVLRQGSKRLLYYIGWNLGVTVPWRNFIGLAVSEREDAPFVKYSRAPIMDRSDDDPYCLSYPWVIEDGGQYRMWYGSNLTWGKEHTDMGHVIKHAVSDDGIRWRRDGRVVLGGSSSAEFALARPCVVKQADRYVMWYCSRGDGYRIYRAESPDGLSWSKVSERPELDVTPGDWDGEMTAYPAVFDLGGARYMLYCGNGYGKAFGLAEYAGAGEAVSAARGAGA